MKSNKNQAQKNFILTGLEGGTFYTLAIAIPLVVSLIFSVALITLNLATNEHFLSSPLYVYLSFALSSLSLLVVIFYACKRKNLSFKYSVGLVKCDKKYYLIAIALAFGALFGLGWLNDAFISFLIKCGYTVSDIVLPKRHFGDFLLCFLIVCVLPAFFEESVFRGLLLNGARRAGDLFAVIACGLLFSLFHKNPAQTVYQLILGMTFTLLTIKSGSVIPAMLFHFINNFYIVVYYFLAPEGYAFDKWVQILLFVIAIACFVLAILYLIFKCKKPENNAKLDEEYAKLSPQKAEAKHFSVYALPGVITCVILWIITLVGS